MSENEEPGSYDPFEGEREPCGFVLRGFFEEYALARDGQPDFKRDFLPELQAFSGSYRGAFPRWSEFVNAYRHHIGLAYLYPQAPHQGALLDGFRFDFDLYYDPPFIAFDDLNCEIPGMPSISRETFFWLALQRFFKSYTFEGVCDCTDFSRAWHEFLRVGAVCYNQTALTGAYKTSRVNSYEEVYRHFFPEEDFIIRYRERLREFIEE
ncbi:MAG: hypothetical protein KDK78_11785, partial [Chlamydiia bacterium]|nr:hypothetical protein [Chlamydiia bacterium]